MQLPTDHRDETVQTPPSSVYNSNSKPRLTHRLDHVGYNMFIILTFVEHSLAMIAKMGPYFAAMPTEIGVLSINMGQL